MTDNRTTELLQELRDLAEDVNPSEIIDHVSITRMGWAFDAQWLDAWRMEFDRIMQAIAATLGNGTLTAEQVMAIAGKHQPDYCSDTHVCFDWQAIADELNAELGIGVIEE